MRKGVIDLAVNKVVNIIEAPEDWQVVPPGFTNAGYPLTSVPCRKGWDVVDGVPVAPPAPPPRTVEEQAALDTAALNKVLLRQGSIDRAQLEGMFIMWGLIEDLRGVPPANKATKADFVEWLRTRMRA